MPSELFDSNILIDFLRGRPQATATLDAAPSRIISIITRIELLAGARAAETEHQIRVLLSGFHEEPLSPAVAEAAAVLRREQRLKLPDAVILATAQIRRLTLVTRDEGVFERGGVAVRVPYRL